MGSDNTEKIIGAREKREMAAKLWREQRGVVNSKKEGPRSSGAASVAVVVILSTVLAWLVTENHLLGGPGYHPTGAEGLDAFLAGSDIPMLVGDEAIDYWILVFLRGIFISIVTGIIPFMTWIFVQLTDSVKGNFYITSWGVTVGVMILGYLGWDMLLPALEQIFSGF